MESFKDLISHIAVGPWLSAIPHRRSRMNTGSPYWHQAPGSGCFGSGIYRLSFHQGVWNHAEKTIQGGTRYLGLAIGLLFSGASISATVCQGLESQW